MKNLAVKLKIVQIADNEKRKERVRLRLVL
jgi:hypothetical protein